MSTTTEEQQARTSERSVTLGKYRVIAKLGTGGMAEVYLAVARGAMNVNRLVVVKRLREDHASDPALREMFLDEARLAARLNHPNVVQTFEAGSEGGSWFLAMEYVEGQPLSRVLSTLMKQRRRLDPKIAARIVADALSGLHHAHELTDFDGTPLHIVHRDVSPQNMMITYGGATKIVDFGIAKAAGSSETEHGVFKGKLAFMAPEQVQGEHVDGRADVFAAGIILWEALVGQHLLADEVPARTLHNLLHKPIPRVSELRPDVPAALDPIVAKALERDVNERYASAKAMRDDLEAFLASAGGLTTEPVGDLVSSMFADRKRRVQEQVKAQLAALSLSRATNPDLNSISKTHVRTASAVIDLSEGASVESQPSLFRLVTANEIAPAPPPRSNHFGAAAFVIVAVLALGVSGVALRRAQTAPAVAAPPTVVTVTVPAPVAPPPTSTPPPSATAPVTPAEPSASAPRSSTGTTRTPAPVHATSPQHFAPVRAPAATASAAAAASPTQEAPRSAAPTSTKASAAPPTDKPQGRTFRREL